MKLLLAVFLFIPFTPFFTLAQSEWEWGLETRLEAQHFQQELRPELSQNHLRLELKPQLQKDFKDTFNLNLRPIYVADPSNKSSEERDYLDAYESYLAWRFETGSLKAGYNVINWGVTDGYNPLDSVNSRQYFNPLRAQKRGEASLVYSQALGNFDFEFIYIPLKQGALLPGTQSRWLPQDVYIPYTPENNVVLNLPPQLRYTFAEREDFNSAREQNLAARLQLHLAGWDFGIIGFEGASNFPIIQPEVTGVISEINPKTVIDVDPDVYLPYRHYRIRQLGGALIRQQNTVLIKYATSYTQSVGDDRALPGWQHESVVGLERGFNFDSGLGLIALVQYSFINSEFENESNFSVTEIFRNAWMGGARITYQENWTGSLLGLYRQESKSSYFEITVARRLMDQWNVALSANNIQGPETSVVGVYDKNDSYSLSIARSF